MFIRHSASLSPVTAEQIHKKIRVHPDFPKPGVMFRDVLPLLADVGPHGCTQVITAMCSPYHRHRGDLVVLGVESRGFLFGMTMALLLNRPFVPARKPGKLPGKVDRVSYKLEYGEAELEVQADAFSPGQDVVVVDDLLATGGTAGAAAELVRRQGARVLTLAVVVELAALGGREALLGTSYPDVQALLTY